MRQNIITIGIIVVGILMILLGGYFLLFNNSQKTEHTVLPTQSTQETSLPKTSDSKVNPATDILRDFKNIKSDNLPSDYFVPLNDLMKTF